MNDIHSQLNRTRVAGVVPISSVEAARAVIERAHAERRSLCIAGGRHAAGGQQFAADALLIDTRPFNRVLDFDDAAGLLEVEAGIQWPELMSSLAGAQRGRPDAWGIAQKQGGANRLCIGGALAANAHGHALTMPPIVDNVASFKLLGPDGVERRCSRTENAELFRLAIGGYGLFGLITSVQLRLARRILVRQMVAVAKTSDIIPRFHEAIGSGALYGDFHLTTDERSRDYMRTGLMFALYRADATALRSELEPAATADAWMRLAYLAHADKAEAQRRYTAYAIATSGRVGWSDEHMIAQYIDGYHEQLDRDLHSRTPATEVVGELYVPRAALHAFLEEARVDFLERRVNLIYSSVRLIMRDEETFLPWARDSYACVIFNIHTAHTPAGREQTAITYRRLIDSATRLGGSYFLTYQRYASREQLLACYPQFPEFVRLKRRYDPAELFTSDWYRTYTR